MAAKHSHKKKQWPDSVLRFREKEEKFFSEKKRRIYIYQCRQNVHKRKTDILRLLKF